MSLRRPCLLVLAALVSGLAGCGPADPLDDRISARTNMAFLLWRGDERAHLTAEEWKWFEDALVDLRFEVAEKNHVHQAEKIDALLLDFLDGKTVRAATVEGLKHKIARLRNERDELSKVLLKNADLLTYEGDTASDAVLDKLQHDDLERRQHDVADISGLHATLLKLGASDPVADPTGEFVLPKRGHAQRGDVLPQPL